MKLSYRTSFLTACLSTLSTPALALPACSDAPYNSLISRLSTDSAIQQICTSAFGKLGSASTVTVTAAAPVTTITSVVTPISPTLTSTITVTSTATSVLEPSTVTDTTVTYRSTVSATTTSYSTLTAYTCSTALAKRSASAQICPYGPSSTYRSTNGELFGICKNVDFPAGDITHVQNIASAEACAETCSRTQGCVAASLHTDSRICYLKKQRNGSNTFKGVDAVYKIEDAPKATTTPTSSAKSKTACKGTSSKTTPAQSTTTKHATTSSSSSTITTTTTKSSTTVVTTTTTTTTTTTFVPDTILCSCIATPTTITTTVTPSAVVQAITITAPTPPAVTSLVSVTGIVTVSTQVTTHVTASTTTTTTTTFTVTSTTSVAVPTNFYTQSGTYPQACNCNFAITCNAGLITSEANVFFLGVTSDSAFETCLNYCDESPTCGYAVVGNRPSDGALVCTIYSPGAATGFNYNVPGGVVIQRAGGCRTSNDYCCQNNYNTIVARYQSCYV